MFSSQEKIQYDRHLILSEIGVSGQEKLKRAKVLVIGAGGLGCPVLSYLTAAGVGTIGIVDPDKVEKTNLQRQVLYSQLDLGQYKVDVAKRKLEELNPFVSFHVYRELFSTTNAMDLASKYDIIVDGTDNFPTRYLINDCAVLSGKPVVFGSIFKFDGQVSVFNYNNGPTYRCLYPDPPNNNEVPNCSEVGVIGVLPGIIGSLQANEVIKMICGIGEVLAGKLLLFDSLTLEQKTLNFEKNKDLNISSLDLDYEFFCDSTDIEQRYLDENLLSQNNFELLDVRTRMEREEFNIGGLHIDLKQVKERILEIPNQKTLVVYCKSGGRSKKAIAILKENGFRNRLISLKGGLQNIRNRELNQK